MTTGRQLHEHVRDQIHNALGRRTMSWLAKASGVPPSTLSNQLLRPRISLDTLTRVANALDRDPASLLP